MAQEQGYRPKQRFDHILTHHLLGVLLRLLFRLYGRWKVIGVENVPKTGAAIFAANHASYVDPPLGWAALYGYRQVWGIARDDLWKKRLVGYLLDSIGVFPVKRNSADRAMFRRALDLLAHGEAVGLFPEGTRTRDGKLQPAQPGVALLVQKSGAPLIPVALLGTYAMFPMHAQKFRRVPLKVVFGKPMIFGPNAAREEITAQLMEAIAALMSAGGVPTEPPVPDKVPVATGD
jgi:1-acyl-sn-glycerol-3-phosphate acyltransferase